MTDDAASPPEPPPAEEGVRRPPGPGDDLPGAVPDSAVPGQPPGGAVSGAAVPVVEGVHVPVARLGVAVAGWLGLLVVGSTVTMPPSSAERTVARGVYSLPDASTPVFEVVMQVGTLPAVVVVALVLAVLRRRRPAAGVLLAGLGAWVVMRVMKVVIERPRPTEALLDHVPRDHAPGWAFPSGHATVSAALATAVVLMVAGALTDRPGARRVVRGVAVAAAVVTALARVHLGVHWPLDVLAGGVVGILAGWVANAAVPADRGDEGAIAGRRRTA